MNRFYKLFPFPQRSCSFLTVVLVLGLQTPVGGKPCSSDCSCFLDSSAWSFLKAVPHPSPRAVLVFWLFRQLQYSAAALMLACPKGLGQAFLPAYSLDPSYASFQGSVVLLIKQCNACQKPGALSGLSLRPGAWKEWDCQKSEQHGLDVIWMCGSGGCKKLVLGSGSILERK